MDPIPDPVPDVVNPPPAAEAPAPGFDLDIIDFDNLQPDLPGADEPTSKRGDDDKKENDLLFDIIDNDFLGESEKADESKKESKEIVKQEEEKQIEEEKVDKSSGEAIE